MIIDKDTQGAAAATVTVDNVVFGGQRLVLIAGPCTVEDRTQMIEIACAVKEAGAVMLRGGAFKPRSSPYAFQGLCEEGLAILAEARERTGLPVVTEVLESSQLPTVAAVADMLQIGSRNMHNSVLLRDAGASGKPVLLKRGMSATIQEYLYAAEYILSAGGQHVVLCERGIRTFETATRFTLDLNAIPVIKKETHLPVIVDPSHGTGIAEFVMPMARAGIAAGCDGLMVEVHPDPAKAMSDGPQSLTFAQFESLVREIRPVAEAMKRTV